MEKLNLLSATNTLITQSLAPAVAITGAALMSSGLLNRLSHLGTRVRQLNQTLREIPPTESGRVENIRLQAIMLIKRARIVRSALLCLYACIGSMVLTAFSVALTELHWLPPTMGIAIWIFLFGLFSILMAVVLEMLEVLLALKALYLDMPFFEPGKHHASDVSD
jgi:Protein of unknown function (DUF2721)